MGQPSEVLGNLSRRAAGAREGDAQGRKDQFGEKVPRSSGTCQRETRAAQIPKEQRSRAAGLLPSAEPLADTPPAGRRTTAGSGSSGSADPRPEWRGTPGRLWLRVARGAAAVLRSRRAGRSSAYSFALMLFLKERDSCEQTGLTETCFHSTRPLRTHNSPGDSFLSAADFKVCNRTPVSGVTSRIWAVGASCGRAPLRLMLGCPWPG